MSSCQNKPADAKPQSRDSRWILTRVQTCAFLSLLVLLIPASTAQAQITFDAAASSSSLSTTTLSWSHTVGGGSNRLLVVGLADNTPGASFFPATSVTYAGQALTRQVLNGGFVTSPVSEIWTLLSPPSGPAIIEVTYPVSERVIGGSVSFAGVNQIAPIRAFNVARVSNGSNPSTLSTNVTSNTGDVVIDAVALETEFTATGTPGAGQTTRWSLATTAPDTFGGGSTKPAAAGSTTMSWILSSTFSPNILVNGALAAISLCPALTITCPANIQTFTDSGKSTATVNPGQPTTTGACCPQPTQPVLANANAITQVTCAVTVKGVRSDGKALTDPYPLGVTLITWTATDPNGKTASCNQTITVLTPTGGGYHPGPVGVCPKGKRRC